MALTPKQTAQKNIVKMGLANGKSSQQVRSAMHTAFPKKQGASDGYMPKTANLDKPRTPAMIRNKVTNEDVENARMARKYPEK